MNGERLRLLLVPGTWILLSPGLISDKPFYVLSVQDGGVFIGHTGWLVSDAVFVTWDYLKNITVIGRGHRRWWWRFIPWRQLVSPFSKPLVFG